MKEVITRKLYCNEYDKKLFILYCKNWNTSLRELAKEFGVSASYLSAVLNGKKPVTDNLKKELIEIFCNYYKEENSNASV